ncbi:uncharacterized protein LOC144645153 isoform X2 [Oculina patagonica]
MQKIYFFVPNLIGYVRIVLNLAAFYFMLHKPFLTIILHFTGGILLDVADGVSARYFNQCSSYGDLLDFLVDRCGRIGMMMALCVFYPQYLFALQLLVCLEVAGGISNHYRCSLMTDPSLPSDNYEKAHCYGPWLLRNYFQEPFLTLVIIGQDVCVAMLYLLHFSPGPVGYVRIVLNLAAFYFMLHKPFLTVILHFTGGILLDVADGESARYLNQCSRYGDLLDVLLDRCGRIGMMMALCVFYPQYLFALQLLVCLEVAGCWSNHYRCALVKDPTNTFKRSRSYDPWLLRIFYKEPITTLVIVGQDVCVAMLYLLHFSSGPAVSLAGTSYSLWVLLAWICAPFLIYRQVVVCGLLLFRTFGDLARLHDQGLRNDAKSK